MAKQTDSQVGGDWRLATLARVRELIRQAIPGVVEERKWRKASNAMAGVPVWSAPGPDGKAAPGGMICTGETYKDKVKLTFAKGASLPDPSKLFNAGVDGGTRRAIDLREGDRLDPKAFKALLGTALSGVESAKASKTVGKRPPRPSSISVVASHADAVATRTRSKARTKVPRLLSGGNPQIAKAVGNAGPAAVRAFIEAMSGGDVGWKRTVGERLDRLIERTVRSSLPGAGLRKAVKWNSPLYGVDRIGGDTDVSMKSGQRGRRATSVKQEWFLGVHCFATYVRVAFFRGTLLRPMPPGASKQRWVRYLDIREQGWGDPPNFDAKQLRNWIRQAATNPGEWM